MAWYNEDADVVMDMPLLGLDNDIIHDADIQVKISSETSSPGSLRIDLAGEVTEDASVRVS